MKKCIVWETSASVAGGQKMTLTVLDLLKDEYEFLCLIPGEGKLAEELKRREIAYVCLGDQTLPAGVKGWKAYLRYAYMSIRSILKSTTVIRSFKPDVLYAPGPAALPWSAVCGSLSRKPVVWHLHHLFSDGPTKKLLSYTSRWKSVRKIVSVTRIVGDQITSPAGRAKVVPLCNPVDTVRYAAGNAEMILTEAEAALGRPIPRKGGCMLMQIAVLRPAKRQDLFIRVVGALKQLGVPVTGILVGKAITEDDLHYEKQLRQMISNDGLAGDIYMAGHRSNVQDCLAAADIVFVPMAVEGLSLVAQEAMAAKRHVMAVDAGGVAELLRDAGCGTLYPLNASSEEIAGIILQTLRQDHQEALLRGYDFCLCHSGKAYRESISSVFASACSQQHSSDGGHRA